jgi:CRP-like cAMP-binding protein
MNQNTRAVDHWPAGSLLGGLPRETRSAMLTLGRPVRFSDEERLLHEGDQGTHVFLLTLGWFKVVTISEDGNEALIVIRTGGDLVGELAVFDGHPRTATVKAAGPGAARRIEKWEFMDFLLAHDDAWRAVLSTVASKLRWSTRRRSEFVNCPVEIRVARVLVEMAMEHGQSSGPGVLIGAQFTQPDLAALVGTSLPTVQRVLRALRADGVLETRYRQILVLDMAGLLSAAGIDWVADLAEAEPAVSMLRTASS